MNCLCCEDEEEVLQIYKQALEDRNHRISVSSDSDGCLKAYYKALEESKKDNSGNLLKQNPFDVVILDYKMPQKNGLEIAQEIFKICPNQRIIFASANVNETVENSLKGLKQVVEVLKKPFDISTLIETIESEEIQEGLKLLLGNFRKKGNTKENELNDEQIKEILKGVSKLYNIKER